MRRMSRPASAVAVVAVVAAVALVAAGLLAPRLGAAAARDDRRAEVLQAARQATVDFTTLDYRHLDRDLDRVLQGATGGFRKQFRAGTHDLERLVTANKAVARGQVLDAGLVSFDDDSARVLVAADSTVTNTGNPAPQKRHYRIQLDLTRGGPPGHSRWLVSDLTFIG